MRPLDLSRSALAAVALCGALVAGMSFRSSERSEGVSRAPDPSLREATPGFYAGSTPPGLLAPAAAGTRDGPTTAGVSAPPGVAFSIFQEAQLSSDCRDAVLDPDDLPPHEFYFTRAIYSDGNGYGGLRNWDRGRRRGRGSWSTDYPKADNQFMVMVDHLVNMDLYPCSNAVRLDDPRIRRFPFLYALEVGDMYLSEDEIHGLRDYLTAGGFLVIDDFWGSREWANFEREMRRLLPGRPIVEIPMDHPIFHTFYDIDEIIQVPNVNRGRDGGPTHERDGYVPHVLGVFDDHDRPMVVINWNTDLGDAWEWAENPYYPLKYSRFAAEMGVNMIIYGLSH